LREAFSEDSFVITGQKLGYDTLQNMF
jgi:hypothetical protein